jgi:hypothetical protein
MALRPKLQNFVARDWDEVRDSWLESVPPFPSIGARPDPGLEHLQPLLDLALPENNGRFTDVDGLRLQMLWEAVFLFHKCSHTSLAAQRLGAQGMYSWCLFNAYHSAYLGAKGIMALLGVSLPELKSRQVAIDIYPEVLKKKKIRPLGSARFQEFIIVRLSSLDQRDVWETFQRVINMCKATCWDTDLRQELLDLDHLRITPPRNRFLYRAHHWPLNDLISDELPSDLTTLVGTELEVDDAGFLLRLSFAVYRLFEQLMSNLAAHSAVINIQLEGSRFLTDSELPELISYRNFVSQTNTQAEGLS